MPTIKPQQKTREARKAELIYEWARNRNSHQEVLKLYRRYTGDTGELGAGTNVIDAILDAEFTTDANQSPESQESSEANDDSSENAA